MLGGASAFKESGPINSFNSYTHQGRHVEATVLDHPTSTRWVCPVSPWESEDASRAHRRHVAPSGIEPGPEIRRNPKRRADLRKDLQVLDSPRWGHERAVENR